MDQYQLNPQAVEQVDVVSDIAEILMGQRFSRQHDDEHLTLISVYIG
jgi:hypothetical protein